MIVLFLNDTQILEILAVAGLPGVQHRLLQLVRHLQGGVQEVLLGLLDSRDWKEIK